MKGFNTITFPISLFKYYMKILNKGYYVYFIVSRNIEVKRLQSSSSSTSLLSGGISGDGGDVFDSADLKSHTGEGSHGGLGSGAGGSGVDSSSSSDFNVNGVDSKGLESLVDIGGGHHGSVGGGLLSVGFDFHSSGDSGIGFSAGKVGDVDEGVVERGEDVADGEEVLFSFELGA